MAEFNVWRFQRHEIEANWPWVSLLLWSAVKLDPYRGMNTVHAKLLDGSIGLASIHLAHGAGLVTFEPMTVDGIFMCWFPYLAAKLELPRKQWIRAITEIMGYFENLARESGCTEMRIGGRDWSFLGYEPILGTMNQRKAL